MVPRGVGFTPFPTEFSTSLYDMKLKFRPVISLNRRKQKMTSPLESCGRRVIYRLDSASRESHMTKLTSSINFICQIISPVQLRPWYLFGKFKKMRVDLYQMKVKSRNHGRYWKISICACPDASGVKCLNCIKAPNVIPMKLKP